MYSRNKQKDKNNFGGIISVKLLSAGIPMATLSAIYASLSMTFGSAV